MSRLFGGIEAGGTKFVCAVGNDPDDLRSEVRFPTTNPEETIAHCLEYFQGVEGGESLAAIGIASFGPIDPNPASSTFGYVTSTPKPGWQQIDLVGPVARALGIPVGFDTDVNGAAMAEGRWGIARKLSTFIYLTIGTGIGGGAMVDGRPLHGLLHPEMGHMLISRREDDNFASICPFHDSCFEGLASGPAIEKRWERRAEDLPEDHPAWELEAHYLGLGVTNLICALSPERVIMGGGVMNQQHLFPRVRQRVRELLNEYVQTEAINRDNNVYIVPPSLGSRSGVLGAIALAQRAAEEQKP